MRATVGALRVRKPRTRAPRHPRPRPVVGVVQGCDSGGSEIVAKRRQANTRKPLKLSKSLGAGDGEREWSAGDG